jgi:hypothetical protein
MKRRLNLFNAFRRDRLAGLWLAVLLLLVPYLQPMSEALAAGKPFAAEICTSFGSLDKAVTPVAADDCPSCISGSHVPQPAYMPDGVTALPMQWAEEQKFRPELTDTGGGLYAKRWLAPPGQAPPSHDLI